MNSFKKNLFTAENIEQLTGLIQEGYKVGVISEEERKTPLFYHAFDEEMIAFLLKKGVPAEHQDIDGKTVLHLTEYQPVAEILIDHNPGLLKITDNQGATPLFPAVTYPTVDPSMIRMMIDKGANINAKNHQRHPPSMWSQSLNTWKFCLREM